MNEIDWRRELRALREPVAPGHDLWPAIAAAIAADTSPVATPRPAAWRRIAMLAAVVVLVAGAGVAGRLSGVVNQETATVRHVDPRLRGAAIELDATRSMLRQSLQEDPGSPLLQRLLARTERQQTRLQHFAHEAG